MNSSGCRPQRLPVIWVVPHFPQDDRDHRYVFLREEAEEFGKLSSFELTICTLDGGGAEGPWRSITYERPSRSGAALFAARNPATVGLSASVDPKAWMPRARRLVWLDSVLRRLRPALVHSHFAEPLGTGAVELSHRHGAAAFVSLRGVDVVKRPEANYGYRLDRGYERVLRRSLSRADRVLTATSAMAQEAIDAGAGHAQVHVLPNAFARGSYERNGRSAPSDRTRVVVVGSLTTGKGFDIAIQAAAIGGFELTVVGAGPEREALETLARQNRGAVTFTGALPPHDVLNIMRASDVFWLTSRFEAFGNVLLEAAHCDLPIVSTHVGVAVDLLPKLDRSAFFDGSATDLASQTVRVRHAEARDRSSLLDEYSPERRRERLASMYSEAIEARRYRG